MSATKARRVDRIHPDPDPAKWMVTVTDPQAGESTVMLLAALARPELIRAAKLAFPDVDGRGWIHYSNKSILQAITTKTLPEGIEDPSRHAQSPRPASSEVSKRDASLARLEARVRDLERQLTEAVARRSELELVKALDHDGVTVFIGVTPHRNPTKAR